MSVFLLVGIITLLLGAFILCDDDKEGERIKVDDINVGDTIIIKGEHFNAVGYSSDGLMRLKKKSNEKEYIIQFDKNVELRLTRLLGDRCVKVYNFKGTVGGDYLNLINK